MPHSSTHDDRRGVTLATSLLLVLLLTVAIVAAFARTSSDRRTTLDQVATVDAYAVAQNGIEHFLTIRKSEPISSPDSLTVSVPGGTAAVAVRRLRPQTDQEPALYAVTSTGWTTGSRYDPRSARAYRTVTQLVHWVEATLTANSAFISLNGIDQTGQPATYDGRNRCNGTLLAESEWGDGLTMLDPADFSKSGNQSPPIINGASGNTITGMGTLSEALTQLGFVWSHLKATIGTLPGVVHIPPKVSADNFNGYVFPGPNAETWPIVFIDNAGGPTYTANAPGRGMLVVTGDFGTAGNSFAWDGLVLVGGRMIMSGNSTWTGSVFSGLNNDDPANPDVIVPDNQALGTKVFQYSSCTVTKALKGIGGWARIPNARADNVARY